MFQLHLLLLACRCCFVTLCMLADRRVRRLLASRSRNLASRKGEKAWLRKHPAARFCFHAHAPRRLALDPRMRTKA